MELKSLTPTKYKGYTLKANFTDNLANKFDC